MRGETSVEPPGQEKRFAERVPMGKAAAIEAHREMVSKTREKSQVFVEVHSRPGGRLRPRGAAPQ